METRMFSPASCISADRSNVTVYGSDEVAHCIRFRAKQGVLCMRVQELGKQLEAAAAEASGQPEGYADQLLSEGSLEGAGRKAPTPLPGLQDVRGGWHGSFQAYGGGGGAASVDFNLKGQNWRWGAYALDQVCAAGDWQ